MQRVFDLIDRVGSKDATVLIRGARGTGKEIAARAVHRRSGRNRRRFATVDCAVAEGRPLEDELFGREPGSPGMLPGRPGLLEAISGGTLLLDEVADLGLDAQAHLLRTLERGEVRPIGSSRVRQVDVRVVATTRKDLEREVLGGRFREDLYYRLDVVPIEIPPLRERREDVPHLAFHFLKRYAGDCDFEATALEWLMAQTWPGNVRELEAVVQRAALASAGALVTIDVLRGVRLTQRDTFPPFRAAREAFEQNYVASVLRHSRGDVEEAARVAGVPPAHLQRMLRRARSGFVRD